MSIGENSKIQLLMVMENFLGKMEDYIKVFLEQTGKMELDH